MKRTLAHVRLVAAFAVLLALAAPAAAAVNLLANPGFETDGGSYTGWFTFGSGVQLSTAATDNIMLTGAAASKVYGGFTGCPLAPQFNVGGFGQAFTPTVGQLYTLSGFSFVSSVDPLLGTDTCNSNRMIAKVVFFDAVSGGNEIQSNEIVIGDGFTPTNQWVPFSVSTPAPAGALRVEALFLYLQPACDPGSVFVDDASFTAEAPATTANLLTNPSFTSGLTGWTSFGNVYTEARAYLVRSRTGAAKLFSTFVNGADSGVYQAVAATAGSWWEFGGYTLNTCRENPISGTNDNLVLGKIVFLDGAGTEIGGAQVTMLDNTSPLGAWTAHRVRAQAPAGTTTLRVYMLFVSPSLLGGAAFMDDLWLRQIAPVGVPSAGAGMDLRQNVPNPFNPSTRVSFTLLQEGAVRLAVYDLAGRLVRTLVAGNLPAGEHAVSWDGKTDGGAPAAAGIYQYLLRTAAGSVARSMTLVK